MERTDKIALAVIAGIAVVGLYMHMRSAKVQPPAQPVAPEEKKPLQADISRSQFTNALARLKNGTIKVNFPEAQSAGLKDVGMVRLT